MLTDRQKIILKIVVEDYIKTAVPVGSKTILRDHNINFSPATIRNECVALEKAQLLTKNHSSSGRIPSSKGYRYYINNLMSSKNIEPIKAKIEKIFSNRNLFIEDIIEKTGEIISEMTHLTTLVIGSNIKDVRLKKIDLLPLDNKKAVVIITLSNGHVENRIFDFSHISLNDLQISVKLFNERLENTLLSEIQSKFKLIRPILENQVKKYDYFLKQFLLTIANMTKVKRSTHGIHYMLENPEFNDSKSIKKAIKLIESLSSFHFFQNNIHNNDKNSIVVKIGDELNNKEFDNISVISTKYLIDTNSESNFALVGPKRLEYDKVLELLN